MDKILASQIVIFATTVRWGNQSSLIQRAIERLDEIHDEIMNTGRPRMTNKVAGVVVIGDSDASERIIGNLANFFYIPWLYDSCRQHINAIVGWTK